MATVTIEEAQANLPKVIDGIPPGGEVVITRDGQPLAQLRKSEQTSWPCKAGCFRKDDFWMAPDFNALLDDFEEYME